MQKFLSQEERERLKSQHKGERDKRVCDRIKAVLLFDAGWQLQQIAYALLISDEAVRQHVSEYREQRKLKPQNGGSLGKLSASQTDALLAHLKEHTYLYAKDIAQYVQIRFGVFYTVPGMTSWLKEHGFSYKKPAVVPGKANREQQLIWLQGFEELKKHLGIDETICFIDGVHPTHNAHPAYGWILKGYRKTLPTNTGRQRLNLSGAFDVSSKQVHIHEDKTLCAASTILFLQQLEAAYPDKKKIHVFCDNARYYKNKEVTAYLEHSKVQMHFLPPYSPNLNLIERLWKLLKEETLYNKYYEKFRSFKEAIFGFLQRCNNPEGELYEKLNRRMTERFALAG